MTRQSGGPLPENILLLRAIMDTGETSPDLDEKCRLLDELRRTDPDTARQADRHMLADLARKAHGLRDAQTYLEKLRRENQRLTSPPLFPAVFMHVLPDPSQAVVRQAGSARVVTLAEEVNAVALHLGDEVLLNSELNVLLARSPLAADAVGETAPFDRRGPAGQLVLRARDQEVLVQPTAALAGLELSRGDQIRWDRANWIAYDRIARQEGEQYFQSELPPAAVSQVGGQRDILRRFLATLTRTITAPQIAGQYQLDRRQTVLLDGPPGCGKTLLFRVAAAKVSELGPCRVAVVKPAEWEDPYVGVTQQNTRATFAALHRAAEDAYVLLYLDEVESIGRIRGGMVGHHSDKFLAAFLAELDGFASRGGVAVVSSTNRRDLLDPAVLERLSDVSFRVPRPDLRGAREIFAIHLPEELPFSPNGDAARVTRNQLIDQAVSRLYLPNADNELCVIHFRDGRTRTVGSRELVSGRLIEQICRAARQSACDRHIRTGEGGIRLEDMDEAVSEAIVRLSSTLSPRNVRSYLADLPEDVDVVGVKPIVRRHQPIHRYFTLPGGRA